MSYSAENRMQDIEMEEPMNQTMEVQIIFPEDSEAGESIHKEDKAIHWRELPQNVWFQISRQQDISTEKGILKILHLIQRDGTAYKVWTTIIISESIDKIRERDVEEQEHQPHTAHLFIKSLGKKTSKSNPDRSYYDIQLKHF